MTNYTRAKGAKAFLTISLCMFLGACATVQTGGDRGSDDDSYGYNEINDPLEGINRATLAMNEVMDDILLEPVARGYRAVVPSPIRTGVRNFLRNLRSPINIANQLLQGDLKGVGNDTVRMLVNSTVGLGGLFDVAGYEGIKYEKEDFGQTLAKWGFNHGAYLVLPLFGPSSFRDGLGLLVDSYADPLRLYLFNTDQEEWYYARVATTAVDTREELLDVLEDLQKNSFDYYAALRSVYTQRRDALTRDDEPGALVVAEIPDFDDDTFYQ